MLQHHLIVQQKHSNWGSAGLALISTKTHASLHARMLGNLSPALFLCLLHTFSHYSSSKGLHEHAQTGVAKLFSLLSNTYCAHCTPAPFTPSASQLIPLRRLCTLPGHEFSLGLWIPPSPWCHTTKRFIKSFWLGIQQKTESMAFYIRTEMFRDRFGVA